MKTKEKEKKIREQDEETGNRKKKEEKMEELRSKTRDLVQRRGDRYDLVLFDKVASLRRNYTTVFEMKTLRTKVRSEETQKQRSNKTNSFKPRLQNIGLLGNKVFWCFHPVYLVAEWLGCIKDVVIVVVLSLSLHIRSIMWVWVNDMEGVDEHHGVEGIDEYCVMA